MGDLATGQATEVDLAVCGRFFVDLALPPLAEVPQPGRELRTGPYTLGPGGVANSAVAARRLGLRTTLVTDVGGDEIGSACLRQLSVGEGIDTRHCRSHAEWQTPLSLVLHVGGDRAFVTAESAPSHSVLAEAELDLQAHCVVTDLLPSPQPWLTTRRPGRATIGVVGWDDTDRWALADLPDLERCTVFVLNQVEALSYTRTDTPERALRALGEHVPVAVVTLGGEGAMAYCAATGECCRVPALPLPAVDTSGAGDVFTAGLVAALRRGWPLTDQLRLAAAVAGLTVARLGGAATAPTLQQVRDWATGLPATHEFYDAFAPLVELVADLTCSG